MEEDAGGVLTTQFMVFDSTSICDPCDAVLDVQDVGLEYLVAIFEGVWCNAEGWEQFEGVWREVTLDSTMRESPIVADLLLGSPVLDTYHLPFARFTLNILDQLGTLRLSCRSFLKTL